MTKEYLFEHPELRQRCTQYQRTMGYYRPVYIPTKDGLEPCFNKGKVSEFKERKYFVESQAVKHMMDFVSYKKAV